MQAAQSPTHSPTARRVRRRLRTVLTASVVAAVAGSLSVGLAPTASSTSNEEWAEEAYRGEVEVVRTPGKAAESFLKGKVFVDDNEDSASDGEKGLAGVLVSNGRDVVRTDKQGRYRLPAFDNMTVSITQPSGYQVPLDEDNVPQFHYNHLPKGSPKLKYGGIEPTGPLPSAVNFPVVKSDATAEEEQSCVIAGDLQTYDKQEVEYARRGAIKDLSKRDDYGSCGSLFVGDIVGDDLSLYPDVRGLVRQTNGPARFLPGNHDLDFDAPNAHSFDTFRAQLAPEYYSYDVGNTHVVALNTVDYPCTAAEDSPADVEKQCADPKDDPKYNGRIDDDQLAWLERDLANVPKDKPVIVASHISLLNFVDEGSGIHQVDQVKKVHELLKGRKAVAVSGHSHTIENMKTGDSIEGWKDIFGIDGLPFPHITAGAISGDWYSGAVGEDGYPAAVGRDGGRPGVFTLDIANNKFKERYSITGEPEKVQTQLGINSPTYRKWFEERQEWNENPEGDAPELDEPLVVDRDDLSGGSWLTTNFFVGATGSKVEVRIDGKKAKKAKRTQQLKGEAVNVGAEFSDPHAVAQQLVNGGSVAEQSSHLWRFDLPKGLKAGKHTAKVTATDSHGRKFTDKLTFEVVGK